MDSFECTQAFQFLDQNSAGFVNWSSFRNACLKDRDSEVKDALIEDDYVELAKKELLDIKQIARAKKTSVKSLFSAATTLTPEGNIDISEFKQILLNTLEVQHNQVFNLYQVFGNKKAKTIALDRILQVIQEKDPQVKEKALRVISKLKQAAQSRAVNLKLFKQLEQKSESGEGYINFDQFSQIIGAALAPNECKFLYNYMQEESGLVALNELKYHVTAISDENKQKALLCLEKLKRILQRNQTNVDELFAGFKQKGQLELTQKDISQIFKDQLSSEEVISVIDLLDLDKSTPQPPFSPGSGDLRQACLARKLARPHTGTNTQAHARTNTLLHTHQHTPAHARAHARTHTARCTAGSRSMLLPVILPGWLFVLTLLSFLGSGWHIP